MASPGVYVTLVSRKRSAKERKNRGRFSVFLCVSDEQSVHLVNVRQKTQWKRIESIISMPEKHNNYSKSKKETSNVKQEAYTHKIVNLNQSYNAIIGQ